MATDPTLARAVQTLAGFCDGAVTQDGIGFNGPDSKFGKALASVSPEAWTPQVQREAWVMVAKYKNQLLRAGIDYNSISEPQNINGPKGLRAIEFKDGKILVFLPYEDPASPKSSLSARWNRDLRGWQVDVSKYGVAIEWAGRNGIPVSDKARSILEAAPKAAPTYLGDVYLKNGVIRFKFEYHAPLIDAIRSGVPGRKWDADAKEWTAPQESVSIVKKLAQEYGLFVTEDIHWLPELEIDTNPMVGVKNNNFAITFNYDAQIVSEVRQMPGSEWSPQLRAWLVPIESADEVLKFTETHKASLSKEAEMLVEDSRLVQDVINASAASDAEITINGFGSEMYQLFPFQRAGVAYSMRAMGYVHENGEWVLTEPTEGGVLIGDEMGLGKTSQGLACLKAAKAFPAVIVCPASLKLNWEREAHNWIKDVNVKVINGTSGTVPEADIYVINYDILSYWVEKFPEIRGLVLDESHYIKNGSAQRSKASIQLSDKVVENGIRLCLSGTPIVNQPLELITQLRVIKRLEEFGGATKFRNVYGRASSRSLASLNRKLRASCYVRRRKADVLKELPPKRWSHVIVEGDAQVMKEYRKAEADIVKYLAELALQLAREAGADTQEAQDAAWRKALRAKAAEQLVSISTLKQLAAKAKMNAAQEWIKNFLENDKKLVVFGWHRATVDEIAINFSNGVKIQGGITAERRQEAVDLFQNSDGQKVIACNIKAAGVGLTLTAASDVLFLEQGWTPSDMEQGADRCHRIGQKDSVTAWLMLAANTIDEDIAALISHKRNIVDRAIDGTDEDDNEENSIIGDLLVALAERGMAEAS